MPTNSITEQSFSPEERPIASHPPNERQYPNRHWIEFYYTLGRLVTEISTEREDSVYAIVTAPFVNYASTLIAAGIISQKFIHSNEPLNTPALDDSLKGLTVSFGYQKVGHCEMRKMYGIVDGIDKDSGKDRLEVTVVEDGNNKHFTRYIKPDWLPLVNKVDAEPSLSRTKPGSLIAQNINSLVRILGLSGTQRLLQQPHSVCQIIDTISRTCYETKQCIGLQELGIDFAEELFLRDLVRPSCSGPEGIKDSSCSSISHEFHDKWDASILSGSLNFLNYREDWEFCDSKIKVAILGLSEPNYQESLDQANSYFYNRIDDLTDQESLAYFCPSTVDYQLFTY